MTEPLRDGFSETGVRLDLLLRYLIFELLLEALHERVTMGLMEGEALLGRHPLLLGDRIIFIDIA